MNVSRGVNLVPSARRSAKRRRTRLRRWIGAGVAWAGLVIAACVGVHLSMIGNKDVAAAGELAETRQHAGELTAKLSELRRDLFRAEVGKQTAEALSDQPDWSLLLAILGDSVGEEIVLRDVQLRPIADSKAAASPRGFEVQVRGFARSQPQVSQYVLRLRQVGLFDEVKLLRTGREPVLNTSAVTFDINCTIRPGGGPGRSPQP